MDFFSVPENRKLILEREGQRCFYTLAQLEDANFVIDHVVSRPKGGNGYRNVVACSREANNRKGATSADNFLRRLFREGYLNQPEFEDRLNVLAKLQSGDLKPKIEANQ